MHARKDGGHHVQLTEKNITDVREAKSMSDKMIWKGKPSTHVVGWDKKLSWKPNTLNLSQAFLQHSTYNIRLYFQVSHKLQSLRAPSCSWW